MAKMKTKKEIKQKIKSLTKDLQDLKDESKNGFEFPHEYNTNGNQQKVLSVLIVGFQWTIGEELNYNKMLDNE